MMGNTAPKTPEELIEASRHVLYEFAMLMSSTLSIFQRLLQVSLGWLPLALAGKELASQDVVPSCWGFVEEIH